MTVLGQETGAGGQRRLRAPPTAVAARGRSTRGASRRRLEDELNRTEGGPQTSDGGSSDSSGIVGWSSTQERRRRTTKSRRLRMGTTQGEFRSLKLILNGVQVPVPVTLIII